MPVGTKHPSYELITSETAMHRKLTSHDDGKEFHYRWYEIAFTLQAVKHRIERSGAYLIAVASKLVDHPLAEKFTLCGMMKDMDTHKPDK